MQSVVTDPATLPRFRNAVLSSFLIFCVLLIFGTGFMMAGAAALAEDYVLGEQLLVLATGNDESRGVYVGTIDELPAHVVEAVKNAPPGLSEHSAHDLEYQIYRAFDAQGDRFAVIILPDGPELPGFGVLVFASAMAISLAWLFSVVLARRFSTPIEDLINQLRSNATGPATAPRTQEIAELQRAIHDFNLEQISRAERESNFARSASHELRTPLTVLQGVVDLVDPDELSQQDRARLARMSRAVRNMSNTVSALLTLYRSEQRVASSPGAFAEKLTESVDQLVAHWDAPVNVELELLAPPTLHSDLAVVALQILASNAIQHAQASTVCIGVQASQGWVEDDGIGVTETQIGMMLTDSFGHEHLGWSILHRICKRTGWQLKVDSGQRGTRVTLIFTPERFSHEPQTLH